MWVTQRSQTRIIFLSGCIPKRQVDEFFAVLDKLGVVVEHCRDVLLRKLVVHKFDEDTSFANCAVTDADKFDHLVGLFFGHVVTICSWKAVNEQETWHT